jgi:hypothetical protein
MESMDFADACSCSGHSTAYVDGSRSPSLDFASSMEGLFIENADHFAATSPRLSDFGSDLLFDGSGLIASASPSDRVRIPRDRSCSLDGLFVNADDAVLTNPKLRSQHSADFSQDLLLDSLASTSPSGRVRVPRDRIISAPFYHQNKITTRDSQKTNIV